MEELVALIAKTYGIAGLIMLSPFVGLAFVWRHNIVLQTKVSDMSVANAKEVSELNQNHRTELSRIQESRVADAKAMSEKILDFVEESAGTSKETAIALDQVRDLLMKMTTSTTRR